MIELNCDTVSDMGGRSLVSLYIYKLYEPPPHLRVRDGDFRLERGAQPLSRFGESRDRLSLLLYLQIFSSVALICQETCKGCIQNANASNYTG